MGRIDEDASTDVEMQPLDASGDAAVPDLDAESSLPDQGQESPLAVEIARQITAPLLAIARPLTVIIVSNDGTHVIAWVSAVTG